jgi:hypothetical protein
MKQKALLVLLIFAISCQTDETLSETGNDETVKEAPFLNFAQFPERQFKSIQLNQCRAETMAIISALPLREIYSAEALHFILPSDSTELIIPDTPILTEFKVFLKSQMYLQNTTHFYEFLGDKAEKTKTNDTFSIFYFEHLNIPFKVTYFGQNEVIRLHFLASANGG